MTTTFGHTFVYLRGSKPVLVDSTEVIRGGDTLVVFQSDGSPVTFNWNHVEFYRSVVTEEDDFEAVLTAYAEQLKAKPAAPSSGGQYL